MQLTLDTHSDRSLIDIKPSSDSNRRPLTHNGHRERRARDSKSQQRDLDLSSHQSKHNSYTLETNCQAGQES